MTVIVTMRISNSVSMNPYRSMSASPVSISTACVLPSLLSHLHSLVCRGTAPDPEALAVGYGELQTLSRHETLRTDLLGRPRVVEENVGIDAFTRCELFPVLWDPLVEQTDL
jgi:hypothetical protein